MSNSAPQFAPLAFQELPVEEMIARSRAFYHSVKTRRSVRAFAERAIPMEVIENSLLAAGSAPSGANQQPWHFVVVTDPSKKREIREAAEAEEREFYESRAPEPWLQAVKPLGTDANKPFLETAPCLIVIFLKKTSIDDQGQPQKSYYPSESVGIATGMLITALHLAGLASLTHTPSPMKFLNTIVGRPTSERPYLILVTGYPANDARVPVIGKRGLDEIATFV